MDSDQLDVVNEQGQIISQASRGDIHKQGLLHQEVHVWFCTPEQEIIFQHRAKDKDTWPDRLDATVGGHVEAGDNFMQTAIKEILEETGLNLTANDFKLIQTKPHYSADTIKSKINNTLRAIYYYKFLGDVKELKIEAGKAEGFESWTINNLINISAEDKKRFIPMIFDDDYFQIFKKISVLEKWPLN